MSEYDPPPPYPGRDNSYNPHSTQSDSDAPGPPDTIAPSASGLNYPPPTTFRYIPLPTVTVLQPHQSLNAFSDGQPNSSNISSPHHHDIQAAPARITLHRVLQSRTTTDESIPLLWDMRYPPHAAVSAHLLDETAASPPMRKMRIRITDWVIKVKAPRGAFLTVGAVLDSVHQFLSDIPSQEEWRRYDSRTRAGWGSEFRRFYIFGGKTCFAGLLPVGRKKWQLLTTSR